ncbi:MAG: helix-turn-helix domain-containing protein [Geminicoccaceae bacterium]
MIEDMQLERAIGAKLRSRRVELGMTQEQLARQLSVTYQQVQKHERGATRISLHRLMELARALDVELDYFLEDTVAASGNSPAAPQEHGNRRRHTIEIARLFGEIEDDTVRSSIAALIREIVARQRRGEG